MADEIKDNYDEKKCSCDCRCHHHHHHGHHQGGAVYGLGFIGAAIYFISPVTTLEAGAIGFLKAIVWPAFLVYDAFKFLIH
jgi:hypothetical protein